MADRGMLFSLPMARALLAGTKTQTRRLYVPKHEWAEEVRRTEVNALVWPIGGLGQQCGAPSPLPPYHTGDRLYVRESYYQLGHWAPVQGQVTKGGRQKWAFVPDDSTILFSEPVNARLGRHHADPATTAWHKRLGRFMPRWASRLTLTVTDVRVERLQDISEADAKAEGIERAPYGNWKCYGATPKPFRGAAPTVLARGLGVVSANPLHSYATLWDSINGDGAWAANPWAAAYSFTVHHQNIDKLEAA